MSSPTAGLAQPRIFNSIAELSDVLDGRQTALPSLPAAPKVRVVNLPDRPQSKRRKTTVAEAPVLWWLNAEYDAVLVNPPRVEPTPAATRQKSWSMLPGLIDWKLVSVAGTAAIVAVFV